MEYKSIMNITDEEIKFLLKDLFRAEDAREIDRNINEGIIYVTMIADFNDTDGCSYIIADDIELTDNNISSCNFNITDSIKLKYQQYLIAKGYHPLWKDNPYIKR